MAGDICSLKIITGASISVLLSELCSLDLLSLVPLGVNSAKMVLGLGA